MVCVTIKSERYDRIEFEFEEFDAEAASFVSTALSKGEVKVEIETVDPAGEPQESRFIEPEEVPQEETVSVEEFF